MKETSNKKAYGGCAIVIAVAAVFMVGVVYAFLGGFAMSLIVGLTELAPETLALVRYIVGQVVNAAWFITVIVVALKHLDDIIDDDN